MDGRSISEEYNMPLSKRILRLTTDDGLQDDIEKITDIIKRIELFKIDAQLDVEVFLKEKERRLIEKYFG